MNRVFVRSGAPLEHRRWLGALKAGRSFATNGPLLEFTLNGRGLGDTLWLNPGEHEVSARVSLRSNVPVDHLEIVGKGMVVREIPLGGNRTEISTTVPLPVDESGWFLLRARTDSAVDPVLDLYCEPLGRSSSGGQALDSGLRSRV
jgi:TolB protein